MRRISSGIFAFAVLLAIPSEGECITVGESDTFSANTENWQQGEFINLRATTGGPGGAGDGYMRVVADGSGEHGKLVVFNDSQWAGNYSTAGVTAIGMAVNNLGTSNLQLRLVFGSASHPTTGGTWYASFNPISVPAASGWTNIQFPVGASHLTRVQGTGSYASLMSSVSTLRLLHAPNPSNRGPNVVATLGVDNILAIGVTALFGDYNGDGAVEAADYVVWRKNLNQNVTIPNDMTSGLVSPDDYGVWRTHFGETGLGTGQLAAVPEPSLAVFLSVIAILLLLCHRGGSTVKA
jgi:hypothetical protein